MCGYTFHWQASSLFFHFFIWSLFEGTLNPPYESSAGKIQRPCTVVFQAGLMFNMLDLTETEQIYMSSSDQKYPLNIQASFHVLLQSLIVVCAKEKTYEDAVKQHLLQSLSWHKLWFPPMNCLLRRKHTETCAFIFRLKNHHTLHHEVWIFLYLPITDATQFQLILIGLYLPGSFSILKIKNKNLIARLQFFGHWLDSGNLI